MIRLGIFIVLTVVMFVISVMNNKRKTKYRHMINLLFAVMIVLFVYNICIGSSYRFNGYSAARANSFIEKNHEWIDMIEMDGNECHFFFDLENDKYRTVFVEKLIIGYTSNTSTHIYPHYEDSIRTIGAINVEDDGNNYSAFLIESTDVSVKEIAIIDEEGNILVSKKANINEPTKIQYEYTGRQNCFNCKLVALNENEQAIYYYGYKQGDNHLSDKDYKWYPNVT